MTTQVKKELTTKAELELSVCLGFKGIFVNSLIKNALNNGYSGNKVKELLSSFKAQQRARLAKTAKKFSMTGAQYTRLQAKALAILSDFDTGHSMGCYKTLKVSGKEFAFTKDVDTYANSCTWRPAYGSLEISLTKKDFEALENIEGIWTIRHEDGRAKWLQSDGQKQFYQVVMTDGFCVGTSHAGTFEEAASLERLKQVEVKKNASNDLRFVGFGDAQKTGACDAGLRAFCSRNSLNPEMGYRIDYLKGLHDRVAKRYLDRV